MVKNKEISIFHHPQFGDIRTMEMPDGQVGFVGMDVATALGYARPADAVATHVDEEDKTTSVICRNGANYKSKTTFINESGPRV